MRNSIKRIRIASYYTNIPNEIIRNIDLSNGAFRMYCLMWADNNEWIEYQSKLCEFMNINEKTARKYMKELIDKGFVDRKINKTGGYDYILYQIPVPKNGTSTGTKKWYPTQDQELT